MNLSNKNKKVLAKVLAEIVESVKIYDKIKSRYMSPEVYRQAAKHLQAGASNPFTDYTLHTEIEITESPAKNSAIEIIKEELVQFISKKTSFVIIDYGIKHRIPPKEHSLDEVLHGLVKSAIVWGPKKAADELCRCAKENTIEYQEYCLIDGLNAKREIRVFDGVYINSTKTTFLDEDPMGSVAEKLTHLLGVPETSMRVDLSSGPAFTNPDRRKRDRLEKLLEEVAAKHRALPDSGFGFFMPDKAKLSPEDGHETEDINSKNLDSFNSKRLCQALSLVIDSPIQMTMGWMQYDSFHPLNLSNRIGLKLDVWYLGVTPKIKAIERFPTLSNKQLSDVREVYLSLSNMAQDLDIPIDRWIQSKVRSNAIDKVIDLAIATESFYTNESDGKSDISFRLSLRAALYLGKNSRSRTRIRELFKKFYDQRSKIMHGGEAKPKKLKACDKALLPDELANKIQDLCRQSLLKSINEGEAPDWEKIELK